MVAAQNGQRRSSDDAYRPSVVTSVIIDDDVLRPLRLFIGSTTVGAEEVHCEVVGCNRESRKFCSLLRTRRRRVLSAESRRGMLPFYTRCEPSDERAKDQRREGPTNSEGFEQKKRLRQTSPSRAGLHPPSHLRNMADPELKVPARKQSPTR